MRYPVILKRLMEFWVCNNEWVSSHLLDRDESEPDLYYAQLEPSLLSRPQATLPLTWSSLSAIRHYLVEKILSHLNSHMESLFLEKLSRLWKCQKKSWRERDWSEVKTMTCRDCVLGSSKIVKEKPSRPCTKATDVLKFYGILHALLGILWFSVTLKGSARSLSYSLFSTFSHSSALFSSLGRFGNHLSSIVFRLSGGRKTIVWNWKLLVTK